MTNRRLNGTFGFGSGGRAKGSRNLLQRRFIEALAKDFDEHGDGVIRVVRCEEPATYLKIIASILPRELLVESAMSEFSDDQVDELIVKIRDHLFAQRQDAEIRVEIDESKMVTCDQHSD